MKILFLTPYVAWPLDHGGRIRTHHLLAAVASAHDVLNLAVARDPRDREDARTLAATGIRVTPALVPSPDMSLPAKRALKWLSVAFGRSSLPGRWRHAGFAALVRDALATERFDLAVIETVWMDVYRPLLGEIPYVASTHNVEADVLLEAARLSRGLDRRVNERDARLLLRREAAHLAKAAAAVAVSAEDAARIAAIAPSARVSVVENGVDTEALRPLPPPPQDGPLLFVASFDYPVNVQAADHLARTIMPAIRARLGPTKLLLAGRRPPPAVHALAALADTEVLDGVADLAPVYARARAVVVPILVGGGSRLKILEALALGRPVVTTTAGMRGLAVRDGVHVLVADTPEAFGDAIARLGSEAGLARQLAAAGRSFVETRHSWPALQSAFLDVVDRAARRASP